MTVLIAFYLRIVNVARRSLWFDEALEYWVATAPFSELWSTIRAGIKDPPLYSYLLHGWLQIGRHEFWIRYLSVFLSMVGILGLMRFTYIVFGRRARTVVGWVAAVSVPHIRFAQEAGQYILMICVLSWYFVALASFMRKDDHRWLWAGLWGGWGLLHSTAIMVLH